MHNNLEPDDLQKKVNLISKKISSRYPEFNLHFVHYLTGPSTKPYSLRRSTVWINPQSWLNKKALNAVQKSQKRKEVPPEQVQSLHEQVLKKYIRYLDRSNTFLDLAARRLPFSEGKDDYDLFIGSLSIEESKCCKPSYTFPEYATQEDEKFVIEWRLNREAVNILVPDPYFNSFFSNLYRNPEMDDDDWSMNFMLAKAELFGKKENWPQRCTIEKMKEISKTRGGIWKELSAIQSVILYFKGANQNGKNKPNCSDLSGTILILKKTPSQNKNESKDTEMAVLTISPSLENYQTLHTTNDGSSVRSNLEEYLGDMLREIGDVKRKQEDFVAATSDYLKSKCGLYGDLLNTLKKYIYRSYTYDCYLRMKAHWALILATKLQGQIHEGQLLSFFLVCGELSEFEDSHNTRIRAFPFRQLKELGWSREELENFPEYINADSEVKKKVMEDIEGKATKVANFICKEHYPWFERGRHALFLDIASGDSLPVGLVSTSSSGWEYIVEERFRQDICFDGIPSCIVFFVSGDPQSSGIIVIKDTRDKTEVVEILRWRNNKWEFVERDKRREFLKKHLKEILTHVDGDEKTFQETIDIVMRISDDPKKGGTIIFVKDGSRLKFEAMGAPWQPNDSFSNDDVIALIGQDGATLRPLSMNKWEYRLLLTPDELYLKKLDKLRTIIQEKQGEWPLEYKGSRRWSAALTAFHKEVVAVTVVSQDGDIQIWNVNEGNLNLGNDESEINVLVVDIPLKDDPKITLKESFSFKHETESQQ